MKQLTIMQAAIECGRHCTVSDEGGIINASSVRKTVDGIELLFDGGAAPEIASKAKGLLVALEELDGAEFAKVAGEALSMEDSLLSDILNYFLAGIVEKLDVGLVFRNKSSAPQASSDKTFGVVVNDAHH